MNKIKVIAEAAGYISDGYEIKKTRLEKELDKTTDGDQLEEFDLKGIIEIMISMVKDIKALYPDEQSNTIYHDNNRLSEIQFNIEIINNKNETVNSFNEQILFPEVAKYNSLSQLILDYCAITDNGEEGTRIWTPHEYDEGPPAGTYAILALVNRDKKWIPNYIDFLRTNDLDHEMEQMWDIERIIDNYGWGNETCKLAIARNVSCIGQGGRQQFKAFFDNGLGDYLTLKENRTMFLKNVIQEFKDYELTPHGLKLLNDTKEYYMKWRTEEINNFEGFLTEEEINTVKEEVARRWDIFNQNKKPG